MPLSATHSDDFVGILPSEYEDAIEDSRDKVSDVLTKVSNDRYDRLVSDAKKQANAKFKKVGLAKAPDFVIKEAVSKIQKPTTYLFDRNHNAGYATFESDSNIVRGIANVFPAFFFWRFRDNEGRRHTLSVLVKGEEGCSC